MLPSFSLDSVQELDAFVGHQTPDGKFVKKSTSRVVFAIAGGQAPNQNLVKKIGEETHIVKSDFLIGKFKVVPNQHFSAHRQRARGKGRAASASLSCGPCKKEEF